MRAFLLLAGSVTCWMSGMIIQAAQLQQPLTPPFPLGPVPEHPQVIAPLDAPLPPRDAPPPAPVLQPNPGAGHPLDGFPNQPTEAERLEQRRKAEAALDKPGPRMPAPGDDELKKLLIARYNAAFAEVQVKEAAYRAGIAGVTFDSIFEAQKRLVQAELELSDKPADQIAALEKHLEMTKQVELKVKSLTLTATRGGELDKYYQAKYVRLDAEAQLLRAKRKAGMAK